MTRKDLEALLRDFKALKPILESLSDDVIVVDRRGRVIYANRKGPRGSPALIGRSIFRDNQGGRRAFNKAMREGRPVSCENECAPFGRRAFYAATINPVRWKGRVRAAIIVARDMTAQKESERKLAASREMLDAVLANVPDFVTHMDSRGKILYINRVAEGLKRSELWGSNAIDYAHPTDRPRLRQAMRRLLKTGEPVVLETRRLSPKGQMRRYRNSLQRIIDKGGEIAILAVSTDVTEVRTAEERLRESQESYRLLFEANPNPMAVGDRATYRWLAVNDAAVKHYGYSREEWLKMTAGDIHPAEETERLKRHPIGFGLVSHGVWKQKKKDGTIIDVDITTNTLRFQGRQAIMGTFRDVTAERQAQAALQRSREDYQRLFQGHPSPMWVGEYGTLRILDVNAAAIKAFGFSREEFLQKNILDLRPRSEVAKVLRAIRTKRPGAGFKTTTVYRRKNGACFDAEVFISDLEFEGRRAFVTSVMDISEKAKAREAEERFASLFNASRDGMNFIDFDGRIKDVNQALCRMLGYKRSELIGRHTLKTLTPPEYHEMNRAAFRQLLSGGRAVEYEKEYLRKDGSRVPVSLTAFVLPGADGRPAGLAGIVRDITERKRLEREILEIGAKEQSHIGRELHDSLGQQLTGLSFLAKSLKAQLSRDGAPQARLAERIAQAASDAVEQVRGLAAGLMPAELLPDGLPAALRAMVVQAEKIFGIDCVLRCPSRLAGMEDTALLHLYRIAQEAVANAAKHAKATKIRITLKELKGQVILEIADNGQGIQRQAGKGLGLKIMAHRAQMVGGTFEVRRGKQGGTVVTCSCRVRRPLL